MAVSRRVKPTLRDARVRDLPVIKSLIRDMQAHERAMRRSRRAPGSITAPYFRELLTRQRIGEGGIVLAEIDGQAVGLVAYATAGDDFEQQVPQFDITELVVSPSFRRRGIARHLVSEVERRAKLAGVSRLVLTVLAGNTSARAAYEALRFREMAVVLEKPVRAASGRLVAREA